MYCRLLVIVTMALCSHAVVASDTPPVSSKNYSYLYFENGYPTRFNHRRPQSEANLVARANPDLVFQTGYYSVVLDCDDITLKGYDALLGSDYRTALNQDVTVVTEAGLTLKVTQGGVEYTCTGALVQATNNVDNVRLIESGQYVKRIDHLGLVFKDAQDNELLVDDECRLEINAWPDRMTFVLDFTSETANPITNTTVEVQSPDGVTHTADSQTNKARLTLKPQEDAQLSTLNPSEYVTQATNLQSAAALTVSFDPDTHAFNIDVPADSVKYPSAAGRVDEYLLEVSNPLSEVTNIPLRFIQPTPRAITGTVMLLSDADSGRPLGIPVQISKNWHGSSANVHQGQWLRGSTMLTLQPGATQRMKLRLVYGYWGGAGTVSHSQLSLIGYNANWKWDESALGAWGESLTFDPTQHLGGAFLDDIRPTFTNSYDNTGAYKDPGIINTTHNWTENIGGGDFLIYRDSDNKYRWLKRLKTCYYQTGPNQTEVHYSGVTDDDKIRVNYTSRMMSTLDYHRHFHAYNYEFLQDVTDPTRLTFFQMAADYYNTALYDNYYIGDTSGLLATENINAVVDPIAGGNTYKGDPISMDGKWLSIDDSFGNSGAVTALALRGLIPLSSTLNGTSLPLHLHKYGRSWGSRAPSILFDFSADSVSRSYSAGDVVAGEIQFILPPQHVDNYWGSDGELIARLSGYGDANWQPVRDELVENIQMAVSVHQGTLQDNYPLVIQAATGKRVLTDFTVTRGGIGHVPLLLKGADAGLELKVQRYSSGAWVNLEAVDTEADTYYQAVLNADGSMDYSFSIPRPAGQHDLDSAWRLRVIYANLPTVDSPLVQWLDLGTANSVVGRGSLWFGDTQFVKHPDSEWTVTNGSLSNTSATNTRVAEGTLARIISVDSGAANGDLLTLSFDYTLNDPSEALYVHLWGLIGTAASSQKIMNLAATNGNAWYEDSVDMAMTNLADGVVTNGAASTAAVALSSTSGAQSFSKTFDLSGYGLGKNNLSDYDYLVLGFARKIDGASAPDVQVSNVLLSLNSKGEEIQPYEKWVSDLGMGDAAVNDDPDGDGMSNLLEYAFGMNPALASANYTSYGNEVTPGLPLPLVQTTTPNNVDFSAVFTRRKNWEIEGLSYTLEASADLTHWENVDETPTVILSGNSEVEVVSVPCNRSVQTSEGSETAKFFRVSVTQN